MKHQTRSLRIKEGAISLAPSAVYRQESLCDYCGSSLLCNLNPSGSALSDCQKFVPIVSFANPHVVGLEGSFSTFRMGKAWAKRMSSIGVGASLMLYSISGKKLIGPARLDGWAVGRVEDMMVHHATSNHVAQARGWTDDASPRLLEVVTKIYGPHIVKPDAQASVIHITRLI